MRQQGGHRVGRFRHARIAEHRQRHRLRRLDQTHGRPGYHGERAFGADQEFRQIRAILRQQVLQGVARDLPGEPAELGADHAEPGRDQGVELGTDPPGGSQAVAAEAARGQPVSGGRQQVQAHHVVGGAAVPQGPGPAGVVTDRAADAGPRMRGRIGAEPQPVAGRGRGDVVEDGAWLHDGGPGVRIHGQHPVQVPGKVEHESGTDRVPRDGSPTAPAGDRHADPGRHPERGGRLVDVLGEGHDGRHHAVVGRVGGVLRPPASRVVHPAQPGRSQRGGQVTGRYGKLMSILTMRVLILRERLNGISGATRRAVPHCLPPDARSRGRRDRRQCTGTRHASRTNRAAGLSRAAVPGRRYLFWSSCCGLPRRVK